MSKNEVVEVMDEVLKAKAKGYEVVFDCGDSEGARMLAYKFWGARRTEGLVSEVGVSLDSKAKTVKIFKARAQVQAN